MSEENVSEAREVSVLKKSTTMDSEEMMSISLKSSDESIDELLSKAMNAVSATPRKNPDPKLGVQ